MLFKKKKVLTTNSRDWGYSSVPRAQAPDPKSNQISKLGAPVYQQGSQNSGTTLSTQPPENRESTGRSC